MKITSFAVIALLLIAVTSDSQTTKQKSIYAKQMTYEIGGDLFFSSTQYTREYSMSTSSSDYTVRDYVINVSAGMFVINGLKLAVEPAFEVMSYENSSSSELKLYLTPEYVFDMNSEVYPFIGGSVGYTSLSSGSAKNGFSWGVKGGIKINPLGNVLINVGISYYQETYNYTDGYVGDVTQHNNVLGLKGGMSLFFR